MTATRSTNRTAHTLAFGCAAMLVSYLPFSAANGALGTIAAATGATTSDLQWVTGAFALALAATVLPAGVLGDLFGRRRITLIGLALTVTGSLIGLLAGSLGAAGGITVLWVAQAVAGLGGGLVMSATLGLVAAVAADARSRQRAISAWAAAVVVGLGAGPFLAGAVTPWASWAWLYAPVAVLAAVVAGYGRRCAAEASAPTDRRLDPAGIAASASTILAVVFGVVHGGSAGWDRPLTVGAFVVAVVALLAFVVAERHASSPSLRLPLFASGGFTAAGVAAATVLFGLVGLVFVLSLLFAARGVTDLGIAVRLGVLFAANAVASLAAARAQTALGPGRVVVTGLVVAAAGLVALTTTTDDAGLLGYAWRLAVVGAGSGLVMATSSAVAVQSVPSALAGMAGAGNNALRQTGAALGAAVVGVVLESRLAAGASFPVAVHVCAALLAALVLAAAAVCVVLLRHPAPSTA